jgi:hypothetical protein
LRPPERTKPRITHRRDMPSLFRFLIFIGLIAGIGYGVVFSLANFFTYHPREIIVTIPPDKFLKPPR